MADIKDPFLVGQAKTASILSSVGDGLAWMGQGVNSKGLPLGKPDAIRNGMATASTGLRFGTTVLALGALTGLQIKQAYSKIQNDIRRKALIEDLIMHDPIIKEAPREKTLEYYATIYNIAPKISSEKPAVRELLQHFVKFGRIDLQTLKTLAETESKLQSPAGSVKDMIFG
jgi:hypothetical protein